MAIVVIYMYPRLKSTDEEIILQHIKTVNYQSKSQEMIILSLGTLNENVSAEQILKWLISVDWNHITNAEKNVFIVSKRITN